MSDLQDVIVSSSIHAFNNGVQHGRNEGHNQLFASLMAGVEELKKEGTLAISLDYLTKFINHGGYFEEED